LRSGDADAIVRKTDVHESLPRPPQLPRREGVSKFQRPNDARGVQQRLLKRFLRARSASAPSLKSRKQRFADGAE